MGTVVQLKPMSRGGLGEAELLRRAQEGNQDAFDLLVSKYYGFVRFKAREYFIAGAEYSDLIQEGLLGLFKAIRDFRFDKGSSFRHFAELCIKRKIITAVKAATRRKHSPLNSYVSFSYEVRMPDGQDAPLEELISSTFRDPVDQVIGKEQFQSLMDCLMSELSPLEYRVTQMHLDGRSYSVMAETLGIDTKSVDNAIQRVKRKLLLHMRNTGILEAA